MARPLSPAVFREEADRRLIDAHSLMLALGLRNKQSVHARVKAGKLPPPVYIADSIVALWDRDDIPDLNGDTK